MKLAIEPGTWPPTPDEIDSLLAAISATGYASECVEIVEEWIESRCGYPGALTAKERAEAVHTVGVEVDSSHMGPDGILHESHAVYANLEEAMTAVTDAMFADLEARYPS